MPELHLGFMPDEEKLQFQTAEYAAADASPRCGLCKAEIGDTYYHLNGSAICKVCAVQRQANPEPAGRAFGKSVLYGLGAALAGSALYGIVLLATGAEFALLSILIGIMVGKAMMRGSGGRGGRKFQIVAVLLTYGSITAGYLPAVVKGMYEKQQKSEVTAVATPNKPIAPGRAVLALLVFFVLMIGLALAAPFLMLTAGFSGILSIAIIFFGLQRAWHKTAGDHFVLTGPYPSAGA